MTTGLRLFIAPTNNTSAELYRSAADIWNRTPVGERNSGFDLFCDISDKTRVFRGVLTADAPTWNGETLFADAYVDTYLVGQGCRALAVDAAGAPHAFWLAPRSSICKTEWRLANSLGLMDATYRGVIKAALWSVVGATAEGTDSLAEGARLCQLTAADLQPWSEIVVVDELPGPATLRGEGGFGSTGA
jgi:dUTPase